MRDVHFDHMGDNNGTINVIENGPIHKPIAQCTSPELQAERTFRDEQMKKEYIEILRRALLWGIPFGLIAALVYLIVSIINGQTPNTAIVAILLTAGPLAVGGIRYKEREVIIQRHEATLREIKTTRGERGEE